jgi:transposase
MPSELRRPALTDAQLAELAEAVGAARSVRLYRRLKAVQWLSEGYPVEAVMRLADVSRSSVYHYLSAYARGGVSALEDAPRGGRPRKLPLPYADDGPAGHEAWQQLLERPPASIPQLDTLARVWTLRLLVEYMEAVHGVAVAEATIHKALSRTGFRRGRTRLRIAPSDRGSRSSGRREEAE